MNGRKCDRMEGMSTVSDQFGRGLRDLRISVTDRCNFRCCYCMPRDVFGTDFPFMNSSDCSRSRRSFG